MKFAAPFLLCVCLLLAGCGSSDSGTASSDPGTIPAKTASDATGSWHHPPLNVTWQWQLRGRINTGYAAELYDIDLFDSSEALTESLHSSGKKVICYFSAGSYEGWRPDAAEFSPDDLGSTMVGWQDEKWLDIRSQDVRRIMKDRLDLAKSKGCDCVEPDNVDGYANDSGFDLSPEDQLAYNRFLAGEAHARGLSVGLKNDLDQASQLVEYFDFAVNEQCHEFDECELLTPFTQAGKPVLNAEYSEVLATNAEMRRSLCRDAAEDDLSTLILPVELDDSFRHSCL